MSDEKTERCCLNCYHYAWFLGYDGRTCELTGKPKKRPGNYTNCKSFGLSSMMDGKVVCK